MLIWLSAGIFIAAGVGLIVGRRPFAHMQSMLAGGNMPPGCVVAEAMFFFLMAILAIVAYRLGYLGTL